MEASGVSSFGGSQLFSRFGSSGAQAFDSRIWHLEFPDFGPNCSAGLGISSIQYRNLVGPQLFSWFLISGTETSDYRIWHRLCLNGLRNSGNRSAFQILVLAWFGRIQSQPVRPGSPAQLSQASHHQERKGSRPLRLPLPLPCLPLPLPLPLPPMPLPCFLPLFMPCLCPFLPPSNPHSFIGRWSILPNLRLWAAACAKGS